MQATQKVDPELHPGTVKDRIGPFYSYKRPIPLKDNLIGPVKVKFFMIQI